MSSLTLVKNAFANVCRGGAAALIALLVPPFLTRIVSKDVYGTWLLILQLSTYVFFLDFGIQTAVGRYVAHHNELGELNERDRIVSTALAILTGSAILAMLGISFLAWQLPNLFKDIPISLHQDAQLSLLYVGGSLAIVLPFSVFGGIFIGLQRYDIPAWIVGVSRSLGGVFVVLVANASHSMVMMAVVMAITNIGGGLWHFLAYKRLHSGIEISIKDISKSAGVEISSYCFSLSIWTIGMILVSGLDAVIIGHFDYQSLVYYSLSASLTNLVIIVHTSIFGVIMPKAAIIGANQDREALGHLLISTTRYGAIVLVAICLPMILGASWFLTLWVGISYANHMTLLLQLMVIGNFIRYLGLPYATIALAVGEQKHIVLSPVIEGLVNITISIVLTAYYGVIGVAIGTLCGAVVSVSIHIAYSLSRTVSIKIESRKLLINAVTKPLISIMPAISLWLIYRHMNLSLLLEFIFLVGAIIISYLFLWNYAIVTTEKEKIRAIINAKLNHFLVR